MERKHTFTFKAKQRLSQRINSLLGVWVGISFSGLLIWNGIIGMPSQIANCNIPYPGNEAVIHLEVGDTLCIPQGEVFTGRIEKLPKGSLIRVNKKAIFQPIGLWEAKGSIDNHGLIVMEDILNAKGLLIDNKGKIDFRHELGADAKIEILNRLDGEINFLASINQLDANLQLDNYGDIQVEGELHLGNKTRIINNGRIVLERSAVINGQISNFGIVQSYEKVLIGRKANIINHCSFIATNAVEIESKGFSNNGILMKNSGEELEKALEQNSCASRFKASKPVVLQFFSPRKVESYARLRWQVEKGSKAAYFEIERSLDNNSFEILDRIDVSEKADQTYKFLDTNLKDINQGTVYYRLKITNSQGKHNFGPVAELVINEEKAVSLRIDEQGGDLINLNFSNPSGKPLEISLKDSRGHELKNMELGTGKVSDDFSLDIKDVPDGTYRISLISEDDIQTEELIIDRD